MSIEYYAQRAYDNALDNNAPENFDETDFTAIDINTETGMMNAIDNEVDALAFTDEESRHIVASAIEDVDDGAPWELLRKYASYEHAAIRLVKIRAYDMANIPDGGTL